MAEPAVVVPPVEKSLLSEVAARDEGNGVADAVEGKIGRVCAVEEDILRIQGITYTPDVFDYLIPLNAGIWDLSNYSHQSLKIALVARGLMEDVRFYMGEKHLFALWKFGSEMVGHPGIAHGGAIAFAFDESFGILFASLCLGMGLTANLNVNYRKPFMANSNGCLHASIDKVEGRKVYLRAVLQDAPNGTTYAEAMALFVIPKSAK
eukprot:TRINITY_DN5317_c0_g1_i1.p1 TRINITY_DN5317_c0_g1~~TRINITY_DN5317_c0_g1_i1.p1  ORF type:complete len:207 (-),score=48.32 TRINITY_DN5317_c0_g1_i1:56-676(-)